MRVLYVDYSIGFGGAIKSLALTLGALPRVEKVIVTSQDATIIRAWLGSYRVTRFRTRLNYRNVGLMRRWLARRLGAPVALAAAKLVALADLALTARNAWWFARLIRRESIQLVHLNNGFIPPEVFLASRRTGVPVVVHLRDLQRDPRPANFAMSNGLAAVIAVSGAVAATLTQTRIPPERVTVIHDPVDLEVIDRAESARQRIRSRLGCSSGDVVVSIFGRIIPWKGQKEFVRAAIQAMRVNPAIRCVLVGDKSDGGDEYVAEVNELIDASGYRGRFQITGYLENVEEYYAASDIVVHASITPEPFGMVVPEAMAARRAVIAADAGGPREVVTPEVNGLLVPPGDIERLTAAILRLAADGELRARLGARGRARVLEGLQIETNARAVAGVYEGVLGGQQRKVTAVPQQVG